MKLCSIEDLCIFIIFIFASFFFLEIQGEKPRRCGWLIVCSQSNFQLKTEIKSRCYSYSPFLIVLVSRGNVFTLAARSMSVHGMCDLKLALHPTCMCKETRMTVHLQKTCGVFVAGFLIYISSFTRLYLWSPIVVQWVISSIAFMCFLHLLYTCILTDFTFDTFCWLQLLSGNIHKQLASMHMCDGAYELETPFTSSFPKWCCS